LSVVAAELQLLSPLLSEMIPRIEALLVFRIACTHVHDSPHAKKAGTSGHSSGDTAICVAHRLAAATIA